MKTPLRWVTSLTAVGFLAIAGLFLSDALGRQKRVSGTKAAVVPAAPIYVNGNFSFSAPQELTGHPPSPAFFQADAEPEITIDLFGNIYVTAIQGVPGGTDLWKSTDMGTSFAYLGEPDGAQDHCNPPAVQCAAAGGGDDQIDVSTGGYLYVSSLWLGNVTMSASYDGGIGGALPGQKWEVNPAAADIVSDDRQWVAAYGPQTVYMSFATTALTRPPGSIGLFITKSTDAGKTFPSLVEITALQPLDQVNVESNLVVDPYTGNLYTTYIPNAAVNTIKLASSTDGGNTWNITTAYTGPVGTTARGVFPNITLDRGGNLHLVFTKSNAADDTNSHVFLTSSSNPSAALPAWTTAIQVDSGPGNTSACEAWAVAGSPGTVNVAWLGSTAPSPSTINSNWNVYFAQVTNALLSNPTIAQSQVASGVHNHSICLSGLGCAAANTPHGDPGNRDLLEYFRMALDPDGNANIVFADSIHNCDPNVCRTNTWYAKQTAGPSAYNPPAGPPPSTFSTNIRVGSPGGEPGIKIDSHNCIFTHTPGNPWLWKSVNNGLSFLPPVNPVLNNPNAGAGDEDVQPVPKPGGVRPDDLYFADLALDDVNIEKSIDGGTTWFEPGPGGAGGIVSASSDRQWLAFDKVPTAADQTIYLMDHELSTETIRFSANTNPDTGAWSPPTSGMTAPELILPPSSTFPNTNPGSCFVNKNTHMVYGAFSASSTTTNAMAPPFGKQANFWLASGAAPTAAGLPPGPFTDTPAFKGVIDSPAQAPSPAPSIPPSAATYGNHIGLLFPAGAIDSAGNIYAVWATNNSRANTVQTGTNTPSTTFDIWMSVSHDGGNSFYGPFRISNGVGTSLMPNVTAGDAGRVEIVWYQTPNVGPPLVAAAGELQGGPDGVPTGSQWNVMFAQSLNADSREPVFTISQASDHPNHNNGICVNGTLCLLGGDRSLADFFQVAIGPDGLANIAYADNGHSSTHVEYTRQRTGPLGLTNPVSTTCIPMLFPVSAVSRKVHGTAGMFDVDLTNGDGIECRSGGASNAHQIVITFAKAVSVGGVSVSSGTATVQNFTVNGAVVTVNLTGVSNAQRLVLDLTNVNDGTTIGDAFVAMNVLAGDTNANGAVNSSDIAQTQSQSGQAVTSANFRQDVTVNGLLNSSDIAFVQSKSGTALP